MRNPGGTLLLSQHTLAKGERLSDSDVTERHDTFNCSHCGVTVVLKSGVDPTHNGSILAPQPHWQSDGMGVCLMCKDGWSRGLICPVCHKIQNTVGGCRNLQRRLDEIEKRGRLVASILTG